MSSWKDAIAGFFVVVITLVIIGVLLALPVMLLWNMVMPDVFGLCKIDFLQALWISLLCKFLFDGIRFGDKGDN